MIIIKDLIYYRSFRFNIMIASSKSRILNNFILLICPPLLFRYSIDSCIVSYPIKKIFINTSSHRIFTTLSLLKIPQFIQV